MNIKVVCIGKLKERYWKEALAEYEKRLSSYCSFEIKELKEDAGDDIVREGKSILAGMRDKEYVIALEIEGKEKSSEELAAALEQLALRGRSDITFVIGGSEGLSDEVKKRADEHLSFSPMTFPHQMMRVILAEQIYRAFTIMRGERYHK
jgi:23S rRNA (pseudouridine1915-N3)-methyltransferase